MLQVLPDRRDAGEVHLAKGHALDGERLHGPGARAQALRLRGPCPRGGVRKAVVYYKIYIFLS